MFSWLCQANTILVNIPFAAISLRELTSRSVLRIGGLNAKKFDWTWLLCFIYRGQNDLPTLWMIICPSHVQWHFFTAVMRNLEAEEDFLNYFQPLLCDSGVTCQDVLRFKEGKLPAHLLWKKEDLEPQLPFLEFFPFQQTYFIQSWEGKYFPQKASQQLHSSRPHQAHHQVREVFAGVWSLTSSLGAGRLAQKQTVLTSVLVLGKKVQCWQPLMWLFHITRLVDAARAGKPPSTAQAGGFCWPCRIAGEENRVGLHLK